MQSVQCIKLSPLLSYEHCSFNRFIGRGQTVYSNVWVGRTGVTLMNSQNKKGLNHKIYKSQDLQMIYKLLVHYLAGDRAIRMPMFGIRTLANWHALSDL